MIQGIITSDLETVPSVIRPQKYGGLGLKAIAYHFGITDPKAKQKMDFWRRAGGVLWQIDRQATISILDWSATLQAEMSPDEMSERELLIHERLLVGRMDIVRTNGRAT